MYEEKYNASKTPKEPTQGFQLFSVTKNNDNVTLEDGNYEFNSSLSDGGWTESDNATLFSACHSTFDFTRIENVAEFTVNYLLQVKKSSRMWHSFD